MLSHVDQSLFGYAIPGIRTEFELSLQAIGAILAISFACASIVSVLAGVAADRFGRRIVFVSCLAASSLLVALHCVVQDAVSLTVLRTLAFSIAAPLGALGTTYTAEAVSARQRGVVTGLLQVAYPLGWFLASLIAAPILETYGWRYTFLPAALFVPLALIFLWLLPESAKFEASTQAVGTRAAQSVWSRSLAELFTPGLRRRTIGGFLLFLFYGGAYAGTAFYFPTYFQEHLGYTEAGAARVVGLSYGIGLIGYLAASVTGEYVLTRRNTIAIWLLVGACAFLGLIWQAGGQAGQILWFGVVAAFFYGVSAVLWAFAAELFPTRARATGTSLMLAAMLVGFATYPLVVPWLVNELGWSWALTLTVVPSLAAAALAAVCVDNIRSGLELEEISA